MGADPDYFFAFDLALQSGSEWRAMMPERAMMERPRAQRLHELWQRL
jgi:hypothetical protein